MQTTTEKIKLITYLILREIKFWNLKNENILRKRAQKGKKNITILHFLTTFHNFTLKIDTNFKLQMCFSPL